MRQSIEDVTEYTYLVAEGIAATAFLISAPLVLFKRIRNNALTAVIFASFGFFLVFLIDMWDFVQSVVLWPGKDPHLFSVYLVLVGVDTAYFVSACPLLYSILSITLARRNIRIPFSNSVFPALVVAALILSNMLLHTIVFLRPSFSWPWKRVSYAYMTSTNFLFILMTLPRFVLFILWGICVAIGDILQYPVKGQIAHMTLSLACMAAGFASILLVPFASSALPLLNVTVLLTSPVMTFPRTLAQVLGSKTGCLYYYVFLKQEYASENIAFIFAVRRAIEHARCDRFHALLCIRDLQAKFLLHSSDFGINLPMETEATLNIAINKATEADVSVEWARSLFEPALVDVRLVLEGSLPRFMGSSLYAELIQALQTLQELPESRSVLRVLLSLFFTRDTSGSGQLDIEHIPDMWEIISKDMKGEELLVGTHRSTLTGLRHL
ncbi:Regulator of G protein signaling domain [Carpediemonas membranifera]|uniref:Regulator of G protein signaling domain n=1 Tax=Carpediemonas membranifera TaxID=201153 RepID=A0A8J6B5Q5_9EUKA|nr:Regulator of G protein signaling domain [Carpediemonas membranifera]|eukprot:KAG9393599.1 Regulator of G protein signaling domain [Carpediemonas membranifera]